MTDPITLSRRGFIVMSLAALAACRNSAQTLSLSGETMGTTYNITAIDHDGKLSGDEVGNAIEAALARVNKQMSNWDPNSEISQFNAQQTTDVIEVSPELAKVMLAAEQVHIESEGLFDVTLGPLIELWGFGARNADSPIPSDAAIADAMGKIGQTRTLTTTDRSLQKILPQTQAYLAAIGKGYGVDAVAAALREFGLKDFMVEIGGDLYVAGNNPDGGAWQIGIETPDALAQGVEKIVSVSDLGMATSGDYRNYFEQDGVRYSHIIDAGTGRPITHTTASVTVLTDDAMMADAWATAMLALGTQRGLPIADKLGLAVLFIDRDETKSQLEFKTTASARFTALQG